MRKIMEILMRQQDRKNQRAFHPGKRNRKQKTQKRNAVSVEELKSDEKEEQ